MTGKSVKLISILGFTTVFLVLAVVIVVSYHDYRTSKSKHWFPVDLSQAGHEIDEEIKVLFSGLYRLSISLPLRNSGQGHLYGATVRLKVQLANTSGKTILDDTFTAEAFDGFTTYIYPGDKRLWVHDKPVHSGFHLPSGGYRLNVAVLEGHEIYNDIDTYVTLRPDGSVYK